jgi:hypothetical protein
MWIYLDLDILIQQDDIAQRIKKLILQLRSISHPGYFITFILVRAGYFSPRRGYRRVPKGPGGPPALNGQDLECFS